MKKLGYFLAVSAVAVIVSEAMALNLKQDTMDRLNQISDTWAEANLQAKVKGGRGNSFRLGDQIQFGFSANQECYVTMMHVDGHGVATLISVSDELGPLTPAADLSYPSNDVHLDIAPPLGKENLHAFCTDSPIDIASIGAVEGVAVVEAEQAPDTAGALASLLAGRKVSVSKIEYRVLGRTRSVEYNVDDVVEYFNTRTRSISRPVLPIHINFKINSAVLTEQAKENLDVIGEAFNNSSLENAVFEIGGHTDALGTEGYNLSLSEQRAASARSYLEQQHAITENRLQVKAYGEEAPRESNDTEEGRAFNRRVEFKFVP